MAEKEKLERALKELKTLTGVTFQVDVEDDADLEMALTQISQLGSAYKEKYNKTSFIQNLLMDNVLHVDMFNRAKKMHIEYELPRVVYIVETKQEKDEEAIELMKHLFTSRSGDFVTAVDKRNIILVKAMNDGCDEDDVDAVAHTVVDMLNAEAMSQVRVSYGSVSKTLADLSKSYKEASMALEVGEIFYMERVIVPYSKLGIGRLIYQLPIPLCKIFMEEVFGDKLPDTFDDETVTTINKFFDNNLNISETARQLFVHRNTLVYRLEKLQKITGLDIRVFDDALTYKIASMVVNYMKYKKEDK